jgi:hypothetical protein
VFIFRQSDAPPTTKSILQELGSNKVGSMLLDSGLIDFQRQKMTVAATAERRVMAHLSTRVAMAPVLPSPEYDLDSMSSLVAVRFVADGLTV